MLKFFIAMVLLFVTNQIFSQSLVSDSTKQNIIKDLELRIPKSWDFQLTNEGIRLLYFNEYGIYAYGCCPSNLIVPKDKKLLKWLREDYLKAQSTFVKISDTLSINLSFSKTWSKESIDSVKIIQDSINNVVFSKREKIQICSNNYWSSTSSKQIIPFYSKALDCSVFFERPSALSGIYEVDYQFGIPRIINLDDKILIVQQVVALILGIDGYCFTCDCSED